MSIARAASSIALWTGLSRVLGFLRDIMIARVIGQGMASDAFHVAFRFPNLFRRLFGEGALNAAFVPLFGKELEQDKQAAQQFARQTFTLLSLLMVAITLLTIVFSPQVVLLLASGYYKPAQAGGGEKFLLTVDLTRICASYSAFLCLAALASGVLNTLRSFAIPAFAPVLLNIITITALAVAHWLGTPVFVLSWAVFVAGIAQLALVWLAAWKKGIRLFPEIHLFSKQFWQKLWTPKIRKLFLLMGPGITAAAAQQIGIILTTNITSKQEEAVSFLYNGDRVQQLPLGVIGVAIGTVLLPELSRCLGKNDNSKATQMFRQGISIASLLTIPAAIALITLGPLIYQALYLGGNFTLSDCKKAGAALQLFSIGMPLWVLVKVILPGYFARENTKTPLYFSLVALATNVLLSLAFFPWLKGYGVALASSISAVVNFSLLLWGLRKDTIMKLDSQAWKRIGGILLASLVMGTSIFLLRFFTSSFADTGIWQARILLAAFIGIGMGFYFLIILRCKIFSLQELKMAMRQPRQQS